MFGPRGARPPGPSNPTVRGHPIGSSLPLWRILTKTHPKVGLSALLFKVPSGARYQPGHSWCVNLLGWPNGVLVRWCSFRRGRQGGGRGPDRLARRRMRRPGFGQTGAGPPHRWARNRPPPPPVRFRVVPAAATRPATGKKKTAPLSPDFFPPGEFDTVPPPPFPDVASGAPRLGLFGSGPAGGPGRPHAGGQGGRTSRVVIADRRDDAGKWGGSYGKNTRVYVFR